MTITQAIKDKINALPLETNQKREVQKLVVEILIYFPASAAKEVKAEPKVEFAVGSILKCGNKLRTTHILLTKKVDIVLNEYGSPYAGSFTKKYLETGNNAQINEVTKAYANLDEFLKKHPKGTAYIKAIFALEETHNK